MKLKEISKIVGSERYQLLGKFYGYPQCCIDHFIERSDLPYWFLYKDRKYIGNGFIPCDQCIDKLKKSEGRLGISDLISNRICTIAYSDKLRHPSIDRKLNNEMVEYLNKIYASKNQ